VLDAIVPQPSPDDTGEPPELGFYCRKCSEREFGGD
jgi:hypothetical protein